MGDTRLVTVPVSPPSRRLGETHRRKPKRYSKAKPQKVETTVSILMYTYTSANGEKYSFRSDPIFKPVEVIRYRMEQQQTATIYVDPNNPDNYYFDLEFLYQ
jgi:hypothetical protein